MWRTRACTIHCMCIYIIYMLFEVHVSMSSYVLAGCGFFCLGSTGEVKDSIVVPSPLSFKIINESASVAAKAEESRQHKQNDCI